MTWGKETTALVELDQPFCTHVFGQGACTAVLGVTGTSKCFQSRATCQAPAAYSPGTLALTFARQQEGLQKNYGYVIPSVLGISTTPGAINLGAMDRSSGALGTRETVEITLEDHRYDDLLVDKYRTERSFVPATRFPGRWKASDFRGNGAAAKVARAAFFGHNDPALEPYVNGTFWGKWLARNPYHAGYALRVREGFMGDAVGSLRVRHYIIDRIEGPTDGQVKIVAKDLFSRIEAKKAVAPKASRGRLSAAITGTPATFAVVPAGIGNTDYAASGHVAIDDEIIQYTRSGDTFTVVARGALNTTSKNHSADDAVQQVLSFSAQLSHDIVYTLLTTYGGIATASIDKPAWDALAASITEVYTGHIAKPTPVHELVGELSEQAGFTVWPDVPTGKIKYAALRAGTASPTVDDRDWIVEGSLSTRRQDAKRVSQVWVRYAQINPLESVDETKNYRSVYVAADVDAESSQQYGQPAIREVFSRWIPTGGRSSAEKTAERLRVMFRDPPLEASFRLHASRDGQLDLGRYFSLLTAEVQDALGAMQAKTLATVQLERGENELEAKGQQVTFAADTGTNVRTVYIENDQKNINLRTLHDANFAAPTGNEVIEFIVVAGVRIGSTSTADPACRTGAWPTMATAPKIMFADPGAGARARFQGKGGASGAGGDAYSGPASGSPGTNGGDALLVEVPFTIDRTHAEIWSGGGGSGGGGGAANTGFAGLPFYWGGAAGGPGAGTDPGATAGGGNGDTPGTGSSAATPEAGGSPGSPGSPYGGAAAVGGGPGLDGAAGNSGSGNIANGSGGAAGSKGRYIVGNALVTWIGSGDMRGAVS